MSRTSIGVNGRRALVAIRKFIDDHDRFPSVSDLSRTGYLSDRGRASNSLRELEAVRLISRTQKEWASGTLSELGRKTSLIYEQYPEKWLPEPKKFNRNRSLDRPAVVEGRTTYPSRVRFPNDGRPLKTGRANTKLGGKVTKGHWKDAAIVILTLEERKTCPRTCLQWNTCYGDNLGLAVRTPHGHALEQALRDQLKAMKPAGRKVVVRLHELGDFYSVRYVELWATFLRRYAWLRVFGYTAWWPGTEIGDALQEVRRQFPERFQIRTSGYGETMGAYVRTAKQPIPEGAFQCPEQEGKVLNCGACGACWSTEKNVVFLQH